MEAFPCRRSVIIALRRRAVISPALFSPGVLTHLAFPLICPAGVPAKLAGALAEPQLGRHHLARIMVGPVVELLQRPGHYPAGDVVDRDGHAGQPWVHHRGGGAAVEAADGEILPDPQPQFRGHAVDHTGEPVAAGHDGVRAQVQTAGAEQRPDLPAGAGVVHQQHVRLAGGDPAGRQSVGEPGGPLGIPVVRRPVAQEGDAPEPPGQHVFHGRGGGPPVVDVDPVLRQCGSGPAEAGERHTGLGQQHHPGIFLLQFGEQEGVHAPAGDQAAYVVARVAVRDDDQHAVAAPRAHCRQRLKELLHDVVAGEQLNARQDVGELHGPARAHAPRAVVRVVPQGGHGVEDPGPGRVAHPSAAVEHVRDGLPGYGGGPRHVLDRYLACDGRSGLA